MTAIKYEAPELIVIGRAIQSVQGLGIKNHCTHVTEGRGPAGCFNEHISAYEDWE